MRSGVNLATPSFPKHGYGDITSKSRFWTQGDLLGVCGMVGEYFQASRRLGQNRLVEGIGLGEQTRLGE